MRFNLTKTPALIVKKTKERVFLKNVSNRPMYVGSSKTDNTLEYPLSAGETLELLGSKRLFAQVHKDSTSDSAEIVVCYL
jgi:hypothetical protein